MNRVKITFVIFFVCSSFYSQNYFPLQIGNKWTYEVLDVLSSRKDTFAITVVGDTLLPNGEEYFQLSKPLDPAGLLGEFVRIDSPYLYFYDQTDSLDKMVYNFNSPLHDRYFIGLYAVELDSPSVTLTFKDTTQIFGHTSKNTWFYLDWLVPFELIFSDQFGPLGWFSAHHDPIQTTLIGCEIDGEQFGILVNAEIEDNDFVKYQLNQNYPNPFNPTTTIEYSIIAESYVDIKVYDILGELVSTLVEDMIPAGNHKVVFNGCTLASGVYFYKMESNGFRITKKFVLLK